MNSKPIKQDFFSNIAPEFDEHVRQSIPLYDDFIQNVKTNVMRLSGNFYRSKANFMHLDVCCSTASLGASLSSDYCEDNYYYDGIDINEEMLSIAETQTKHIRNCNVHNMDFYKLNSSIIAKYDLITELLGFQFFTKTREPEIDRIKSILTKNGIAVFCEKFKTPFFGRNEYLKDTLHKSKSFTQEQVEVKRETVLSDMHDYLYNKTDFEELLCKKFKYVKSIYVAGNFAAYACSDCPTHINSWDVWDYLLINEFNATQNYWIK